MPILPKQPQTPDTIAVVVGKYVLAFIRVALWTVVALATAAFVYVAIRGILFAVQAICRALGV